MTLNHTYMLSSFQISKHFIQIETLFQLEQGNKFSNYIMQSISKRIPVKSLKVNSLEANFLYAII